MRMNTFLNVFLAIIFGLMAVIGTLIVLTIFWGCTYSINMIHSEGTATDLIDENQTAEPDISVPVDLRGV